MRESRQWIANHLSASYYCLTVNITLQEESLDYTMELEIWFPSVVVPIKRHEGQREQVKYVRTFFPASLCPCFFVDLDQRNQIKMWLR